MSNLTARIAPRHRATLAEFDLTINAPPVHRL